MAFLIYLAKHLFKMVALFACLIAFGAGFGWLSDRIEFFGAYVMLAIFAILIVVIAWQDYQREDKRK